MWLGVVITEVLFEFAPPTRSPFALRRDSTTKSTSSANCRYCSPLLVTGTASLVAVGSNLICTLSVFQRRRIEDENVLLAFRRRTWTVAAIGVVFATPALYLGLVYFRQ